jgi:hypothetical protein
LEQHFFLKIAVPEPLKKSKNPGTAFGTAFFDL